MVNEVAATVARPTPIVIKLDTQGAVGRVGRAIAVIIVVAATFVVIGIGVAIFHAVRPATGALDALNAKMRDATRTLSLSELSKLSERGYRQVEASEPPGGWTAFDPVAGIPWISEVARAWAPDARLTRIDLALIAANGTADLTSDRQDIVGYRFSSPARIAEWERIADREVNASVPYELMVRVAQRKIMVYVHSGKPPQEALPPVLEGLPLHDLLTRARQNSKFPEHPFYSGFLIHLDRMGWVWRFQSLSQRDSIPWIRAKDAAVYPWR
jgi:hypothetical protein